MLTAEKSKALGSQAVGVVHVRVGEEMRLLSAILLLLLQLYSEIFVLRNMLILVCRGGGRRCDVADCRRDLCMVNVRLTESVRDLFIFYFFICLTRGRYLIFTTFNLYKPLKLT